MKEPNILVFTVTSWNSKVGANSWESLLSKYDSARIANICIREEHPDSSICSRYFVISENRVIKSVFNRKIKTGYEVNDSSNRQTDDLIIHNHRYAKFRKKRSYLFLLIREIIWKLGKWKSKELLDFIDSFAPDVILHSMDGYIHFNRIINFTIKRTNAKSIGYIWDDNFTYQQHSGFGFYIYRFFQRRSLKNLAKKTEEFFSITEKTKREADAFFNINSYVLTKPLNELPVFTNRSYKYPIKILYTGNLLYGRGESLLLFLKALASYRGLFEVEIYTSDVLDKEILNNYAGLTVNIFQPIPQLDILKKQKEADLLLFLEALDSSNKVARLSFSTKITDYLSAGKSIFAIGNKDLAPIEYFINTDSAIVSTSFEEIQKQLQVIVSNIDLLNMYASKAIQAGICNHNPTKIHQTFDDVLKKVANG